MTTPTIRRLVKTDLDIYYYNLLNQLSKNSEDSTYDHEKFVNAFENLSSNTFIFIIIMGEKIIGTISIIIEQKLLHNGGKVGHIEDFVIDKYHCSNGFGSKLLDFAVDFCKENSCYKCILNCSENLKKYYEKHNFQNKNIQMSIYFE
jgi:glucosamine-phosphate N-acetyltransferase